MSALRTVSHLTLACSFVFIFFRLSLSFFHFPAVVGKAADSWPGHGPEDPVQRGEPRSAGADSKRGHRAPQLCGKVIGSRTYRGYSSLYLDRGRIPGRDRAKPLQKGEAARGVKACATFVRARSLNSSRCSSEAPIVSPSSLDHEIPGNSRYFLLAISDPFSGERRSLGSSQS